MKITIMAVKTTGNTKRGIAASGVTLVDVKPGENNETLLKKID